MAMRVSATAAVAVTLLVGAGCLTPSGTGPPVEWFPLKHELTPDDLRGFRASFTPTVSGDYDVTLTFQQPIELEEVRDLVNRAAASVGTDNPLTRFDFDWRLLDGDTTLARGTGRRGASRVIDAGSQPLGGGTLKSRALAFGKFTAEANHPYTFEFKAGPAMDSVVGARPALEISLDPRSRR